MPPSNLGQRGRGGKGRGRGRGRGGKGRGRGKGQKAVSDGLTKHQRKMKEVREAALNKHGFSIGGMLGGNKGPKQGNEIRELKVKLVDILAAGQVARKPRFDDDDDKSLMTGDDSTVGGGGDEPSVLDLLVVKLKETLEGCIAVGSDLHEVFDHFDKDKGGTLDSDEFQEGLRELGMEVSLRDCKKLMERFSDDPERIDYQQFVKELDLKEPEAPPDLEEKAGGDDDEDDDAWLDDIADDVPGTDGAERPPPKTAGELMKEEEEAALAGGDQDDEEGEDVDEGSRPMTLRFEILAGRNLLAADKNGSSDPYAVAMLVHADSHKPLRGKRARRFKTKHKKKTLSPDWDAPEQTWAGLEHVNTGHVALRVVVYDKDAGVLDADDPLGGVIIELAEGTVLEEEYKLKNKPAKMKDGAQGTVRVRLSVVGDGDPPPPHWTLDRVLDDVAGMLGEVQAGGVATISVLHPCPVVVARKKVAGLTKGDYQLIKLVYRGQKLSDTNEKGHMVMIPEECYHNEKDEDTKLATYLYASKIDEVVVLEKLEHEIEAERLAKEAEEKAAAEVAVEDADLYYEEEEEEEEDIGAAMEQQAESSEDEDAQEKHERKLKSKIRRDNREFEKMMKAQQVFNLEEELLAIDCVEHFELLRDAGYAEKGAFAFMEEEDICGTASNMSVVIGKRPRRRIMALADLYRRQMELEFANETTAMDDINAEFRDKGRTFTYDGKNFFPNKREMEAAYREAEEYADVLKQMEVDRRNKEAKEAAARAEAERLAAKKSRKNKGQQGDGKKLPKTRIVAPPEERIEKLSLYGGMDVNARFAAGISADLEGDKQHNVDKLEQYLDLKAKGLLSDGKIHDPADDDPYLKTRTHGVAAIRLIREISEKNVRDELGLPSNFFNKDPEATFCCEKHGSLVQVAFSRYLQSISFEVRSWVREEINDADIFKNSYIPRHLLVRIVNEVLFEYGVEPTAAVVDQIFVNCVDGEDDMFYNYNEFMRLIDGLILREESRRLHRLQLAADRTRQRVRRGGGSKSGSAAALEGSGGPDDVPPPPDSN